MKNQEVTEEFIRGDIAKTKNLFIERTNKGNLVLYSYGHHFPLAIRLTDSNLLINSDGYSKTTAIHKGALCRSLGFYGFKELLEHKPDFVFIKTTEELKKVLDVEITTIQELTENKI